MKREMPVTSPRRVRRMALRLYLEMKDLPFLGEIYLAALTDVTTVDIFHSALSLHFYHSI